MDAITLILALWISGVGIIFWKIFLPAMKILRNLEPD